MHSIFCCPMVEYRMICIFVLRKGNKYENTDKKWICARPGKQGGRAIRRFGSRG